MAISNNPDAINYLCQFLDPGDFATWLLRFCQGDKTAQEEAVTAFAASIERCQEARDSIAATTPGKFDEVRPAHH
ncbi:hypothetical protein QUA54_14350 [Microcoleus sp. MOSTC5]|uniref:hypothetical protein n=1 Tax=Microcoleus sp. MOSTC5 TaxID=3055378 RepID=UPI002FD0A4B3